MSIRRAATVVLVAGSLGAASAVAAIHHPGKWTTSQQVHQIFGTAVNMMLLPGTDPNDASKSQVLWWADDHDILHSAKPDSNIGGRFDWTPPVDADINAGNFPDTTATGTFVPDSLAPTGFNIFCSGMAHLPSGQALVVGGTKEAENGENHAALYDPLTKQWTALADTMRAGRWYPTATTMPDGRVLITSGSRYRHMWLFGGGAAGDSNLNRMPVSHRAAWEATLLPDPDESRVASRPVPRRGHTATWSLGARQAIFGGQATDGSGAFLNDLWLLARDDNQAAGEYRYFWQKRSPTSTAPPSGRAFHSSVSISDANLVVVGGRHMSLVGTEEAVSEVWSARLVAGNFNVRWKELVAVPGGDTFPPRFGHASFWHAGYQRAYVFGGSGEPGGAPTDAAVYALQVVDSNSVRWKLCTIVNPESAPSPRMAMATGVVNRRPQACLPEMPGMLLYGGRTSANVVTDELYALWPIDSTTVRWQLVSQQGARPPALEYPAGTATENSSEFWVVGGKTASGAAISATYSFSTHVRSGAGADTLVARWEARAPAPSPVWGHTFPVHEVELFARVPELYDPNAAVGQQFTALTSAPLLQDWYPQMFTVPNTPSTVYFAGPNKRDARSLSVNGGLSAWSAPLPEDLTGFRGGSSVMYRAGKIMKCGSRDTDADSASRVTTKILDVTSGSPHWVVSDSMRLGRANHNLVLLPNGKVLVVGGMGHNRNAVNDYPRRSPEIWDPDANSGLGLWEGAGFLDSSHVVRGYHSSALLLPDGRILCAGGNGTTDAAQQNSGYHNDQLMLDLYSPPYLFTTTGTPAERPTIVSAPRHASFCEPFTLCSAGNNVPASMVLVRPAAVTHGYDESQRFVPLAFQYFRIDGNGTRYYHVTIPADSASVPPGEYMLFILNAAGTPSIARWIRVNDRKGDADAPTLVSDLTKSCSTGGVVDLEWLPPAADASATVAAPATEYDLRYSTSPMSSVSAFLAATRVTVAAPGDPLGGNPDRVSIDLSAQLASHPNYYFRLRARNSVRCAGTWSDLSNTMSFYLHDEDCGGAGGGGGGGYLEGLSARRTPGRTALRRPGGGAVVDSNFIENTLLPVVRLGVSATDRIRLPFGPRWVGGAARVRLSRSGALATHFEAVRLVAVAHPAGEETFVEAGEIVAGTTSDALRIMHADGRDLTAALASGSGFDGGDGDTIYAEFEHDGPGAVAVASSRSQLVRYPDQTGIQVACETASGWVDIGHHDPRRLSSDEVFPAPTIRRVRLVFMGVHRLEGIARFITGGAVSEQRFAPTLAQHSRNGDVTHALSTGEGSTLLGGEYLYVDFAPSAASGDSAREWYLEVTGSHQARAAATAARIETGGPQAPVSYSFAPLTPNPFRGSTTLVFELPQRGGVRIEVFDVLGRKVVALANSSYAAGRHSLEWEGRDGSGALAPAGVYLVRMNAGAFRARQHVVLVR